MTEQLSIFDIEVQETIEVVAIEEIQEESVEERIENRLSIGDSVQVTAVPDEADVEAFHYLQTHNGRTGMLSRIIKGKVVCFEIEYPNGTHGIFYETEITKLGGISNETETIGKAETPPS